VSAPPPFRLPPTRRMPTRLPAQGRSLKMAFFIPRTARAPSARAARVFVKLRGENFPP
jgi:hypothetical protein